MGLRTASVRRPYAEVMAPALTDPAQKQSFTLPSSKPKFDNCDIMSEIPSLNDQNMGLHKTCLDKMHKNELDPMLQLAAASPPQDDVELPQNVDELMQDIAIDKLFTEVDMMNISMEDQQEAQAKGLLAELKTSQSKIERRLDFLIRKIRKFQARTMGQHVGGEVAGIYEYVHRSLKRLKDASGLEDDRPVPMKPMSSSSAKTLLKKLEMAATLQSNSSARQKNLPKYFGSGSSEPNNHRISVPGIVNVPPWPIEHKQELQKVSGLLHSELGLVQHDVDSEATESSSGGESCDEMQNYNNPHQQYLSIQKRALWKYASQRAAIASRWTWLQAQISDLEYRIRQHSDIQRQIRSTKGEIQLGGASPPSITQINIVNNNNINNNNNNNNSMSPTTATVNGYRGQLPGNSPITSKAMAVAAAAAAATTDNESVVNGAAPHVTTECQCARTRPLINFKKRKLLQLNGLHVISKKATRPSTVRCGCSKNATEAPCAVCTGRTDPTHPRDPTDALSKAERIALVDPGFHPVFSMAEDVSYGIHTEAIMKNPEWQQRSTRMKSLKILKGDRSDKSSTTLEHRSKKIDHRKKYGRLLKPSTMSALSAKLRNKFRGRKAGRPPTSSSSSSSLMFKRKPKMAIAQLQSLTGADPADEEVESIGGNSSNAAASTSPSSSPLLHMQTISGYYKRNRTNSYDIDNIVIPYSIAAATRVEKLQYKEIPTPKWRIADVDFKCDSKNNGAVRNPSQDSSDVEDLSEEAVIARHEKSECEEKKKFLSYLKLPSSHGRSRSHKRTDSLAESSGANTPDPQSPHPQDHADGAGSPLTSPPATPLPITNVDDAPSIRRRTISQSKTTTTTTNTTTATATGREESGSGESVEAVAPYESRTFPLDDDTYEKMLRSMPENHQFKTNYRAQDSCDFDYLDKVDSPGSESTESAVGDEDPNDPEWVDMERRDRHKR